MKDIDEELRSRIKNVFEDVNDGQSDLGWALLLEKYQDSPKKRFPFTWFAGIAAVLTLIAGTYLFFQESPQTSPKIGKQEISKSPVVEGQTSADTLLTNAKEKNPLKHIHDSARIAQQKAYDETIPKGYEGFAHPLEKDVKLMKEGAPERDRNSQKSPVKIPDNDKVIAERTDTASKDQNNTVIANIGEKTQNSENKKLSTEEFLRDQSALATKNGKTSIKERKDSKLRNSYEVFTGTFLNFYGDNEAKVNAGFGLNANLKVSEGLILSVGAGISQNKITYESYNPNSSRGVLYASPSVQAAGSNANMLQSGFVSNTRLNAQLLSLDLPITLKFYPSKKKSFYLSTGFNSSSYFAQQYDYIYTVSSGSTFINGNTQFEETEKSKFKGFDLANSAIIAIGIHHKMGENTLIFEPYLKPAIRQMGDKNLKINTAGINLKFNFGKKVNQ